MRVSFVVPCLAGVLAFGACAGNPYGYARTYSPLGEEDDYYDSASMVTYEDVRRTPGNYGQTTLGWFGVVTAVDPAVLESQPPQVRVTLSHRIHQERHLCGDERSASCRVTVSDRSVGDFHATLVVPESELQGDERIQVGSLIKVYGTPDTTTAGDGNPTIRVRYYRHWPRGTYATAADRERLRR